MPDQEEIKKLLRYDLMVSGRKRCPFCKQDGRDMMRWKRTRKDAVVYFLSCPNCSAQGPACYSRSEAESGWNGNFPPSRSTRLGDMASRMIVARAKEISRYCFVDLQYRFCAIKETHPLGKLTEKDLPCFVLWESGGKSLVTVGPGTEPIVVSSSMVTDKPFHDEVAAIYKAKQKDRDEEVKAKPDRSCLGFACDVIWEVEYEAKKFVGWQVGLRKEAKLVVTFEPIAGGEEDAKRTT